ncbi:hypothetical protein Golob_009349 [Gossypium lobatum]|uniref:Uncharacterized protein n=1 Tax=Gossypium lobatum TaxID=34289 RepID=A0A7J8MIH3_9ROSI|nr:hypothetical protein [Gossypium lobatum]
MPIAIPLFLWQISAQQYILLPSLILVLSHFCLFVSHGMLISF